MKSIKLNDAFLGYLFVILSVVGFSIKSIFIKFAYLYHIQTMPLLTLRMLFSAPFYLLFLLFFSKARETKIVKKTNAQSLFMLILAAIFYYLSSFFDMSGLNYISVALERIILFIFPTFVVIFSMIFLKKEYSIKFFIPFAICYLLFRRCHFFYFYHE